MPLYAFALQTVAFLLVCVCMLIQRRINAKLLEMIGILRGSIDILNDRLARVETTQPGDAR